MRRDVYEVLKRFSESTNLDELDSESKRYLETSLIDVRHNGNFFLLQNFSKKISTVFYQGLLLDEDKRDKIKELKQKISNLQLQFCKHLIEEKSKFHFKKEDLGKEIYFIFNMVHHQCLF
jgi:Zn-dependent oligopeptidase